MKNKKLLCLIVVIFLFAFERNGAQYYYSEHIGVEEGLSQSSVSSIVQDKTGYLWFGTSNGLNRYDGYDFYIYKTDPDDENSISNNAITSLYVDNEGTLWVGTTDGVLNKYLPEKDSFERFLFFNDSVYSYLQSAYYDYPLPISRNNENTITSITEDNEGYLWIGSWGRGLIKFDKNTGNRKIFTHDPSNPLSINFNRVTKVLVDRLGVIWVATFGGGLNKIIKSLPIVPNAEEEILFFNYSHNPADPNSIADDKIITLFEDTNNALWIGAFGGGVDRLDFDRRYLTGKSPKFIHYRLNEPNGANSDITVMSVIQSSRGNLWIGTLDNGLCAYEYKGDKFYAFEHAAFIYPNSEQSDILSLFEDNNGNLWIGSHLGDGIRVLKEKAFKFGKYQPAEEGSGLNDKIVWALLKDKEDNLWIGTYKGGINILDTDDGWKYILPGRGSITDFHIRCFAEDDRGNVWIGTYSGGLNFYNKRTRKFSAFMQNKDRPFALPSNQIQALLVKGDTLWVGAFGGGLRYLNLSDFYASGKAKFKTPAGKNNKPMKLSDDRIYTLSYDDNGNLCIGTFGGGLNIYNLKTGELKIVKNQTGNKFSLTDNRVISLLSYNDGLLIGTYGGGLNYYDENTDKVILLEPKNKNLLDAVYGMVKDNRGRIWLSTDNGIFKFNPKDSSFTQYDIYDGLQSMEFSGGAFFKDKSGKIYFGGINGVNYFHPDSIVDNSFIPPVVITSIKIFDRELKGTHEKLRLRADQNFFSFQFAALDYTSPVENKYAFKMEGFEDKWHFTSADNRIANYTNLAPGSYVFKVKATNNDGIWNETGAFVEIEILPPFYSTWWFITLAVLSVLSLITFIVTFRIRQLLTIEKLKSGLAADLHDNIGAGLTEISILSELAAKETEKFSKTTADNIKGISEKARQLVDGMSDIVWFINPQRDSLYDFAVRLKDSYADTLHQLGIQFKTVNLDKLKNLKLPMNYKQNLFLIFKESLNNAIKHSNCKKIVFEADMRNNSLYLGLYDDGSGFDEAEETNGNGIFNIKRRAEEIGGKLTISSEIRNGTRVEFVGKIKKKLKFNK